MAKVKQHKILTGDLVKPGKPRVKAPPKPKPRNHLRSVFRRHLAALDLESLKKPWMATKSFVLIDTKEKLRDWVDATLADKSRWVSPRIDMEPMPVLGLDTETIGLDTRILTHFREEQHVTGNRVLVPVYEVKSEIAGVCLSSDGITGIYIPINHEGCPNVSREDAHMELQRLFNASYLVFYNAKFDREVLRLTLALELRDYPFYEDVQILNYINDPKADLGDDTFVAGGSGLKGLSKLHLGIEQIDLDDLTKVSAFKPGTVPEPEPAEPMTPEEIQEALLHPEKEPVVEKIKTSMTRQHVPFTWVPTDIAVWYAGADAICTWLLWFKLKDEAQSRKLVHKIDGEMIDTLTWLERQRTLIDVEPVARISKWHTRTMAERRAKLRELAVEAGWVEAEDEDGNILEETIFEIDKPIKLKKLLYEIKKMQVVKRTPTGEASTDAAALLDLNKLYPEDPFLKELTLYKEYVALHPDKLTFDPHDNTIRLYIKQARVAGGRLAAAGGNFERDGGFGMNPQAIKSVGGNWWVKGNVLHPDYVLEEDVIPHEPEDMHPSCYRDVEEDKIVGWKETQLPDEDHPEERSKIYDSQYPDDKDSLPEDDPAMNRIPIIEKVKVHKQAPGIIKNHIGNYLGFSICLVPSCTSCASKFGVLMENEKLDANQIVNFRQFFIAQPGWFFFTSDYSSVEMRAAANLSGEPSYIKEFLEGTGDFHTLTATIVFPEFTAPGTTKARRKELRALAKIINFALQYGGTEYTIYQNMKKQMPDITWEQAKKMVRTYWEGVPVYKSFVDQMQAIAKDKMTCTTIFGRVVKFASLMRSLGIHEPTKEEMENYWTFVRIRKQFKLAEIDNDIELMHLCQSRMDALLKDKDTGVKNAQEYNRFLGKIQRIATNIPSQGTTGDFMRIALNHIRMWATLVERQVQSVFKLHSTVHDEIDYSVKAEYAPFVVPRVTRMMRLRKWHAKKNWIVPLECDTEYGHSWDVKYHLTGDPEHKPDGWTAMPTMREYLPPEFDMDSVEAMLKAIRSGKESAIQKVKDWMKENLHPRAVEVSSIVFNPIGKGDDRPESEEERRTRLIAILQIHEYWTVDGVHYDCDADMETLEQYEARCGLTEADRGFMPEMGYLGSVPLGKAIRPELPRLGEEPGLTRAEMIYAAYKEKRDKDKEEREAKKMAKLAGKEGVARPLIASEVKNQMELPLADESPVAKLPIMDEPVVFITEERAQPKMEVQPKGEPVTLTIDPEEDLFAPEPKRKVKPKEVNRNPTVIFHPNPKGLPVVRTLRDKEDLKAFVHALGIGDNKLTFMIGPVEHTRLCGVSELPKEFRAEYDGTNDQTNG